MKKITVNREVLIDVIAQLQNAFETINGFGDCLFDVMIDDEAEIYRRAEGRLYESIEVLCKLIANPPTRILVYDPNHEYIHD